MKTFIIVLAAAVILGGAVWYFVGSSKLENNEPATLENKGEIINNNLMDNKENVMENQTKKATKHVITLSTTFGDIVFETYSEDAPKTVENFVSLAQKKYFDGLTFHRVIKGFMIQGGDPNCTLSRTAGPCGTGGPGYKFNDELNPETASYKAGYKKGVVAMANAGPNTNGSQFFIMLEDTPLPKNYTIFGKVVRGQNIVDMIGSVKTGIGDRPVEQVIIKSVSVTQK